MNVVHAVHGRSAVSREGRRHHRYDILDDSATHLQEGGYFRAKVTPKSRIDLFEKENRRIRRMHLDKLSQPFCCARSGERSRIRIDGQHVCHESVRREAERYARTEPGVDTRSAAIDRSGKIIREYKHARRNLVHPAVAVDISNATGGF
jgi:hypothetical protein